MTPKLFVEIFVMDQNAVVGSYEEILTNFLTFGIAFSILNSAVKSIDKSSPKVSFWEFKMPSQINQLLPLIIGSIGGVSNVFTYYQIL